MTRQLISLLRTLRELCIQTPLLSRPLNFEEYKCLCPFGWLHQNLFYFLMFKWNILTKRTKENL